MGFWPGKMREDERIFVFSAEKQEFLPKIIDCANNNIGLPRHGPRWGSRASRGCEKHLLNYFDCAIVLLGCRGMALPDGEGAPVA